MAIENKNVVIYGKEIVDEKLEAKQDVLVSGENIKTINGQSVLGEGDIEITGGSGGDVDLTDYYTKEQTDEKLDIIYSEDNGFDKHLGYIDVEPLVYIPPISTYNYPHPYYIFNLDQNNVYNQQYYDNDLYLYSIDYDNYGMRESTLAMCFYVGEDGSMLESGAVATNVILLQYTVGQVKLRYKKTTVNGTVTYSLGWLDADNNVMDQWSNRALFINCKKGKQLKSVEWTSKDEIGYLEVAIGQSYYYTGSNGSASEYYSYITPGLEYRQHLYLNDGDTKRYFITNEYAGRKFASKQSVEGKQDILKSGTNIKTINGQSILGYGNLEIEGGGGSGDTYTKSEIDTKLADKQNKLKASTGIEISSSNSISSTVYQFYSKIPYMLGHDMPYASDNERVSFASALNDFDMYFQFMNEVDHTPEGTHNTRYGCLISMLQYGSHIYTDSEGMDLVSMTRNGETYRLRYYQQDGNFYLKIVNQDGYEYFNSYLYMNYRDSNTSTQYTNQTLVQINNNYTITLVITKGDTADVASLNNDYPYVTPKESIQFAPYYNTSDGNKSFLLTKDNFINVAYDKSQVDNKLTDKQNKLVSGTNIKTLNGQNLLGSGNIITEWWGTEAEYDAIETKDPNITYFITE